MTQPETNTWQLCDINKLAALQSGKNSATPQFTEFLNVDSMHCGLYFLPKGSKDMQSLHDEDEMYYVFQGSAKMRVNCVAPGAVFTEINQRSGKLSDDEAYERLQNMKDLHALGRIGEVEEVAEAIAYFLSAQWTTGTILEVDGGMSLGITQG
jgi:hypothetical protein